VKVWVLVDFWTSGGQRYMQGQQTTLPEGPELNSLIAYGIVSKTKPSGVIT
jgi:hypothetical protein